MGGKSVGGHECSNPNHSHRMSGGIIARIPSLHEKNTSLAY